DGPTWGCIKVDITGISDAHSLYLGNDRADNGLLRLSTTDPVTIGGTPPPIPPPPPFGPVLDGDPAPDPGHPDFGYSLNHIAAPVLNLIRRPGAPFSDATLSVMETGRFHNQ